jgi:hypothetical protein
MKTTNLKKAVGLVLICVNHFIYPQGKIDKSTPNVNNATSKWNTGAGIYVFGAYQMGAINVQRNPFSQTLFSGWSAGVLIKSKNNPHLLIEYGTTLRTKLSSDWIDIREQHVNANAFFEAFASNNNRFLTAIGVSYKQLDGFYTGVLKTKDYSNLYKDNTKVRNSWIGLNVGLGYEVDLFPFSLFGMMEMPVVWSDVGFGINDFILKIGLKQKLPFKQIFRKNSDRYHWF